MAQEYAFTFPLPNGLHARPASHLQAVAARFEAAVTLVNDRSAAVANAKSVLSLVAADVRSGDACRVRADGPDERAAIEALAAFARDTLPTVDEAVPAAVTAAAGGAPLPRSLVAAGLGRPLRGTPVSPGTGTGTVVTVGGWSVPAEVMARPAATPDRERAAFAAARRSLCAALSAKAAAATNAQEKDVLVAHLAIADDVALAEQVERAIAAGRSAVQAVAAAADAFAATLAASTSEYLRERSLDVRDVSGQLLQSLCGAGDVTSAVVLDAPSVVVADSLTPGQFLGLDKAHLRGLVLSHGGTTSHTVILARSMGVPTVVGVADAVRLVPPGRACVVDADLGVVAVDPTDGVGRYYAMELAKQAAVRDRLAGTRDRPGVTADGRAIEVAANVASADEVEPAIGFGAQGVGLFRTEMVFMDRPAAPTEDEQADIYGRAAAAAAGRPVIIRLLDAGGDKPVPYLSLPAEANPFLGYRAVRFYADFKPLILSQLRAILRATAHGDVRVMVPMVCCVEEVRAVRAMVAEAAESLAADGTPVAKLPPVGIMVEVPSVAMVMDLLADECDFFSIGSNDLTQYLLAADRDNAKVAALYGWSHPAVLRTLKAVVDGAHAKGKWVGLCGELGDVPAALPALVGLGLDEISVSGPRVPAVKRAIAGLRYDQCRAAVEAACGCSTRAGVEAAVAAAAGGSAADLPLLSADLVLFDVDATTKHEAIKATTDALAAAGRTTAERAVEEAAWVREEQYSTGFGYGMAIPHCKTLDVAGSSLVVARLRQPVDWGSADGEPNPVDVVVLLAVRAAGSDTAKEHMRVFAKLSRMVMRDEFRDRLRAETDRGQLLAFLQESLDLQPRPV